MINYIQKNKIGLILRFVVAWLFGSVIMYFMIPVENRSLEGTNIISDINSVGVVYIIVAYIVLWCIEKKIPTFYRAEKMLLVVLFIVLGGLSVFYTGSRYFAITCLIIFGYILMYVIAGQNKDISNISRKSAIKITWKDFLLPLLLCILLSMFLSMWSVLRVLTYNTHTLDLGWFSQMYHWADKTGKMATTIARNRLTSHFSIHISPVYYLLLPVYHLFPSPITLQILQSLIVASSMIPLYLITIRHVAIKVEIFFICLAFCINPLLIGGIGFDFHENCFLALFICWMLYYIEKQNTAGILLFGFLSCIVKEDAPIYVICIAIWMMLSDAIYHTSNLKSKKIVYLLLMACVYFVGAVCYLSLFGEGAMSFRYANLVYGEEISITKIIKTIVLLPMKLIYECSCKDRISYIFYLMAPVACMPVLTRRFERFILFFPCIAINLMTYNPSQHSLHYQYNYGTAILIMYLAILNYDDIVAFFKRHNYTVFSQLIVAAMCIISVWSFYKKIIPRFEIYYNDYVLNYSKYEEMREVLNRIPKESSVAAYYRYTTQFANHDELIDISKADMNDIYASDFVVINPSDKYVFQKKFNQLEDEDTAYRYFVHQLQENGYYLIESYADEVEIYGR